MAHKSRPRSSNLFLMELILAIFFFSVASAVCLQFFVKSHLLSREAKALNEAVNVCTSISEVVRVSDSSENAVELLQGLYPEGDFVGTELTLYYDDIFTACTSDQAGYILKLELQENEQMLEASMQVTAASGEAEGNLYELEVLHHIARRTGYGQK